MRHGNWIPLDKALVRDLPTGRPFTKLEAMFSVTVDYDNGATVSVAGMAARWGWNRKTVKRFLDQAGIEIVYLHDTEKKQNQRGQIRGQIRDRPEVNEGQMRFINFNSLAENRDRSKEKEGQMRGRSRDATINPIDPDPKINVEKNSVSRPYVPVKEIVGYLNKKTGCCYRVDTTKTQSLIKARFREGFTLDDFRMVIDRQVEDWLNNPEMVKYLRPETLFGNKFEGYLQVCKAQGRVAHDCGNCQNKIHGYCHEEPAKCQIFLPLS